MRTITSLMNNFIYTLSSAKTYRNLIIILYVYSVYKMFPIWIGTGNVLLISLYVWTPLILLQLGYRMIYSYLSWWVSITRCKIINESLSKYFNEDGIINKKEIFKSYLVNKNNIDTMMSYVIFLPATYPMKDTVSIIDRFNCLVTFKRSHRIFRDITNRKDLKVSKEDKSIYKIKKISFNIFKIESFLQFFMILLMIGFFVACGTILTSTVSPVVLLMISISCICVYILYFVLPIIINKSLDRDNMTTYKKSMERLDQIIDMHTAIYAYLDFMHKKFPFAKFTTSANTMDEHAAIFIDEIFRYQEFTKNMESIIHYRG